MQIRRVLNVLDPTWNGIRKTSQQFFRYGTSVCLMESYIVTVGTNNEIEEILFGRLGLLNK
jgi:hypothetical protein